MGVAIKIVNPSSLIEVTGGSEGEVWVSSHSSSPGYWSKDSTANESGEMFSGVREKEMCAKAKLNAATFRATVRYAEQRTRDPQEEQIELQYLRTGDLGLIWKGELYITGKCKKVHLY